MLPFVTIPRIPGRDFSGEVIEVLDESGASDQEWVGAEVWGTGSERGFTSDGTFSQWVFMFSFIYYLSAQLTSKVCCCPYRCSEPETGDSRSLQGCQHDVAMAMCMDQR